MPSVYALGDPRTGDIRYIGIAQDVYKRYAQHLNRPHPNNVKNAWMQEIKQAGIVPTLSILEADVDEAIIYEREKYWIEHYLTLGAPLTNIIHGHVQRKRLEEKDTYTLRELIENLPYSLREFGRKHDISEVTIARLRDGKPALRSTINKLLIALSEAYGKTFTMHNVRGISIRGETQDGEQEAA